VALMHLAFSSFTYMGKQRVVSMKMKAQNFDSFGDWNMKVIE